MAAASMAELFGSDSEDEGDSKAADAAPADEATGGDGSDDAGDDADADAASDLFGSDDDGDEGEATAPASNLAVPVAFALPSMPRPPADSKVCARGSASTRSFSLAATIAPCTLACGLHCV